MKRFYQLSVALCFGLLGFCGPDHVAVAADHSPETEVITAGSGELEVTTELARDFELVAFKESGITVSRATVLRRMQAPLTMTVDTILDPGSATAQRQIGIVSTAVEMLESGAGIRFVRARLAGNEFPDFSQEQRGFIVMFSNRATIDQILRNTDTGARQAILSEGCGAVGITERSGIQVGALLLVDSVKSSLEQSYCVHREMVANLGLGGFLSRTDSIFSDSRKVAAFSTRDLLLIRMLYDPRLRPGMTAAQAQSVLPAIAADAQLR
jgi:hypothetical protein